MRKVKDWSPGRKPKKYLIYLPDIQERIYRAAKKISLYAIKKYNLLKKKGRIIKANAYGSIVRNEIGIYNKRYNILKGKKRYGSDIDLVIIAEKGFKAPRSWKYIKSYKDWYDEYTIGTIDKYIPEVPKKENYPMHPINFIIMIPGIHNLKDSREFIGVDEKFSRKKGFKVETWYINGQAFKRIKHFT